MANITLSTEAAAPADTVWDAVRDVGALHTRLVPGHVVGTEMLPGEPPVRRVTFASGVTVDELIVDLDDAARRLCWTIRHPSVTHHNGVMQVTPLTDTTCRVDWVADFRPDGLLEVYRTAMTAGLARLKATMEAG